MISDLFLLKRPKINIEDLEGITKVKDVVPDKIKHITKELMIEAEAQIKYEGYIKRQIEHVKKMKEHITIHRLQRKAKIMQ